MAPQGHAHRLSALAFATATIAALLLGLALVNGVSQGQFQVVRPAEAMTHLLVASSGPIRLEIFIDSLFLVLYGSFFALLPAALEEHAPMSHAQAISARAASAALLLTALFDAMENAHILAELASASNGLVLSQTGIALQAVASQVKFVVSYFGLFILSFALDAQVTSERLLALVLRWVQAPIGVAIFVAEPPLLRPLYVTRAVFFVVGMLWIALVLRRRASR
jgi:hypothetical protein